MWRRHSSEQQQAETLMIKGLYEAALAAAQTYDDAMSRTEEGAIFDLFGTLRSNHLDAADGFRKQLRKLGGTPEDQSGVVAASSKLVSAIQGAGSIRDLLRVMRQGEEYGVAMCRATLDDVKVGRKSRALIEDYSALHLEHIRDLSAEIALRSSYRETAAAFAMPQWLQRPGPGFWLTQGALVVVGYLFGRRGRKPATFANPPMTEESYPPLEREVGV